MQLHHDEVTGPMRGMHGSMDAELEVQRTIKRAEPTAFLCLLKDCRSHHGSCRQQRNH